MYAGLWVPRVVLPVSAGITVAAAVGSGDRMAQRRDWRQRAWYVAGVFVPSTASSGGYQSSARRTVAEVDPRMTVLGSDVGKETRRRDRARPHRHRKARLEHSALPCCQAAGKWLYVHRVQANSLSTCGLCRELSCQICRVRGDCSASVVSSPCSSSWTSSFEMISVAVLAMTLIVR